MLAALFSRYPSMVEKLRTAGTDLTLKNQVRSRGDEAKPADEAPSAAAAPASVAATSESSPVSGEVGIVRSGLQEAYRDALWRGTCRQSLRRSLAARMKHPL